MSSPFDDDVDTWVLAATKARPTSFDDLVCHLPGIYPTEAAASLERLAADGSITPGTFERSVRRRANPAPLPQTSGLPVPHPLDFDWRFTDEAVDLLLGVLADAGPLLCIGAPSVLQTIIQRRAPASLLIDANDAVVSSFERSDELRAVRCTVGIDPLPDIEAASVILDPPWYPEHVRLFLWAAARLSRRHGRLLLSFPAAGTRPGVAAERDDAIAYGERVGLRLSDIKRGSVAYCSPPFEQAALEAAGYANLPLDWRRSDLLVFEAADPNPDEPCPRAAAENDEWVETPMGGPRLKVRRVSRRMEQTVEPTLRKVVDGDILPSVSRRDTRRELVDVWTASNRVFGCADPVAFAAVAQARAEGIHSPEAVAQATGRPLNAPEIAALADAERQADELLASERESMLRYGWTL